MNFEQVINALQQAGTAQNRKVYQRHGVRGEFFGVSYTNLNVRKMQIKKDTALADRLWKTGNHDARILATIITDPQTVTEKIIDAWTMDLDHYVITDAVASLVNPF
jgi:3-methyladenine DNA glycosylase AlkD